MNYLCWLAGPSWGGCEEYAVRAARHFHTLGWKVEILCAHGAIARECRRRLATPAIRVPEPAVPAFLLDRWLMGWREPLETGCYRRFLRRHRFDVVHAPLPWHEEGRAFIRACVADRVPLLVTFQLVGPDAPPSPEARRDFQAARDSGIIRFCAVSAANRRRLEAYYGLSDNELALIPNRPATTASATADPAAHEAVRRELGLATDAPVILTVGGLRHQKGHDLVVRALPQIAAQVPQAVFAWAGEGEERARLEQQARENGVADHIRFLGHRTDVPRLIAAADLFLFPTRWEGESFALAEAAAHGLPIAVSEAGPDWLREGDAALVFRTDDPDDLARAVLAALADPAAAARRARTARDRLAAYTEADMWRETVALLERTAAKAP
jgi:glycosyltransferase involved in cell wall biosynthesis